MCQFHKPLSLGLPVSEARDKKVESYTHCSKLEWSPSQSLVNGFSDSHGTGQYTLEVFKTFHRACS